TSVNCTVTLQSSKLRATAAAELAPLFTAPVTSIVTSTGLDDAGVFEPNLRDDRYLPFEGAGAGGTRNLPAPEGSNAFGLGSIADFILHMRSTAREGGAHSSTPLQKKALFNARRDFPDAWQAFQTATAGQYEMLFALDPSLFPFFGAGHTISLT